MARSREAPGVAAAAVAAAERRLSGGGAGALPPTELAKTLLECKDELAAMKQFTAAGAANAGKGSAAAVAGAKKAVGAFAHTLLTKEIARHRRDKSVPLLAACCVAETLRLYAPLAPFSDSQFCEVLRLYTSALGHGLSDPSRSTLYGWALDLVRSCIETRAVVVFLDLDADEALVRLFEALFDCVVGAEHSSEALDSIASLMAILVTEMDDVSQPLLDVILGNLLKAPTHALEAGAAGGGGGGGGGGAHAPEAGTIAAAAGASAPAWLARALLERCEDKLDAPIARFLRSAIEGDNRSEAGQSDLRREYRRVVLAVHAVQPRLLLHVLPALQSELEVEDLDSRSEAVATLGRVFAAPPRDGVDTAVDYKLTLFKEFLRRFADRVPTVRVQMLEWGRKFLESRAAGATARGAKKRGGGATGGAAAECAAAVAERMAERLSDTDDRVREAATSALLGAATSAGAGAISQQTLEAAAERLADKRIGVRRAALSALAQLYRKQGSASSPQHDRLGWVPGRVLQALLPSLGIAREVEELLAGGMLMPAGASAAERAACWAFALAKLPRGFASAEAKALLALLARKDEGRVALLAFLRSNPAGKAKEGVDCAALAERAGRLAGGDAMGETLAMAAGTVRDARVWRRSLEACDAEAPVAKAAEARADALSRLGGKHSAAQALRRCLSFASYDVLDCEMAEAAVCALERGAKAGNAGRAYVNAHCMLLRAIAAGSPELLESRAERLASLAAGKDKFTARAAVNALAVLGTSCKGARDAIAGAASELERHALGEGREAAKDAVVALSTLGGKVAVESLERVCAAAVEEMSTGKGAVLPGGARLPSLLQAVACAAQRCSEAYAPHEGAFARFLVQRVLSCPCGEEGDPDTVEECLAASRAEGEDEDAMDEDVDDAWDDVATPASTAHELAIKALARSFDYEVNTPAGAQRAIALRRKGLAGAMRVLHAIITKGGELSPGLCGRGLRGAGRRARCRVVAAKGILRLARRWDAALPPALLHEAALVVQDSSYDARVAMLGALRKRLLRGDLKARWAGALALSAVDVERDNADAGRAALDRWASKRRRLLATRSVKDGNGAMAMNVAHLQPEASVAFLVHLLSHHPDYDYELSPPVDAADAPFGSFQRVLACLLGTVLAPDANASLVAGGGALHSVLALLRGIKRCSDKTAPHEDVGGPAALAAARRLHVVADVAITVAKALAARGGASGNAEDNEASLGGGIALPASLFTADTAQHKASTDGANLPPGFELLDLKGYMVADKKGAKKGAAAKATKTTKGGTKKAKTTIAEPANDIDVEKATAGDEEGDTDDEESEEEQEVLPVSRRARAAAAAAQAAVADDPAGGSSSPPKRSRRGSGPEVDADAEDDEENEGAASPSKRARRGMAAGRAKKVSPPPAEAGATKARPLGDHNPAVAGTRRSTRASARA